MQLGQQRTVRQQHRAVVAACPIRGGQATAVEQMGAVVSAALRSPAWLCPLQSPLITSAVFVTLTLCTMHIFPHILPEHAFHLPHGLSVILTTSLCASPPPGPALYSSNPGRVFSPCPWPGPISHLCVYPCPLGPTLYSHVPVASLLGGNEPGIVYLFWLWL